MIYTVTAIHRSERPHSRCFGYYLSKTDAFKAVEKNLSDLHEYLYQYAVIERNTQGIHGTSVVMAWFKWSESNQKGKWVKIEKPEWAEFTNWNGIG
jgi:hypothetical protein